MKWNEYKSQLVYECSEVCFDLALLAKNAMEPDLYLKPKTKSQIILIQELICWTLKWWENQLIDFVHMLNIWL